MLLSTHLFFLNLISPIMLTPVAFAQVFPCLHAYAPGRPTHIILKPSHGARDLLSLDSSQLIDSSHLATLTDVEKDGVTLTQLDLRETVMLQTNPLQWEDDGAAPWQHLKAGT